MRKFPNSLCRAVLPVAISVIFFASLSGLAFAMSPEERASLDLSRYKVNDKDAGYFDIGARRAELANASDPVLLGVMQQLRKAQLCQASRLIPIISGLEVTPRFYEDRDAWRRASAPYHDFEDMVSRLAAQQFIVPGSGAGNCLITMLDSWAQNNAFLDFDIEVAKRQTWYQIESSLFAAAFAYSIVRGEAEGRLEEKRRIETWLVKAAKIHLAHRGTTEGTCCNNHFYRRALYAAVIGVVVGDDDLFRIGISAVYSALSDAAPNGALRLEMVREQYAAKYQVYATMYLAFIAEVAARQGYDLYQLEFTERKLDEVISFAIASMLSPEAAADAARTPNQHKEFLQDKQYYGWLELLTRHPQWRDAAQALLATTRPAYNRSLGGFTTLYFAPVASSSAK